MDFLHHFYYLLEQVYCLITFANGRIDSNFNSQPMKKPSKSVASRVSLCPMDNSFHFAYNYCSTHFCAFQVYAEKLLLFLIRII